MADLEFHIFRGDFQYIARASRPTVGGTMYSNYLASAEDADSEATVLFLHYWFHQQSWIIFSL